MTQQAMGRPTYVLYDAHHGEGFVQVQYRPHQSAADVAFLSPGLDDSRQATNIWTRLLDGMGMEVAARGIQRLFASLPDSGAELDVFQHAGFGAYAREDIYRLAEPAPVPAGDPVPGVRLLQAEDWPALQKLCVTVTPQRIRQVEGGVAAAVWGRRSRLYVLPSSAGGTEDELLAAVSIHRGGLAHWLRLVVPLDACDVTPGLLRWSLAQLAGLPPRPVYCHIRQYESCTRDVLIDHGFEPHHTRTLLAKQTVAYVKAPAHELVPVLKGGAEPVPPGLRSSQQPAAGPGRHATHGKNA